MAFTSETDSGSLERQRGKNRKFRGTTTVLASILKIGSSRGRNDKMTVTTAPPVTVNSNARQADLGARNSSKTHQRRNVYQAATATCNVYHPRIPPYPGTYLTTMNASVPMLPLPSPSSTHLVPSNPYPIASMSPPIEQTYYMASHCYSPHASNQPPMGYTNINSSSSQSHTNLQSYMYMKAYLRDPWSDGGFRLMILLPVGHREDGTYGILNPGVKPEQVYSLSFYYADSILYYTIPEDAHINFIPSCIYSMD